MGSCLGTLGLLAVGAGPVAAQYKIIGYSPSWTGGINSYQWDKLTHINYAFLNPNDGQTAAQVPSAMMKHAPHTRAMRSSS